MRYINAEEIAILSMYWQDKKDLAKSIKYEKEFNELQAEYNRD